MIHLYYMKGRGEEMRRRGSYFRNHEWNLIKRYIIISIMDFKDRLNRKPEFQRG